MSLYFLLKFMSRILISKTIKIEYFLKIGQLFPDRLSITFPFQNLHIYLYVSITNLSVTNSSQVGWTPLVRTGRDFHYHSKIPSSARPVCLGCSVMYPVWKWSSLASKILIPKNHILQFEPCNWPFSMTNWMMLLS